MAVVKVVQHGTYTDSSQRCTTVEAVEAAVTAYVTCSFPVARRQDAEVKLTILEIMRRAGSGEPVRLPNGKTLEIVEL